MKVAEAFVEIRAETTKAERDVRKKADSLGKTFAQIFGAAAFTAGMKKSIDAASDLNETVSKSKVIFGDAAKEMERLGDKAAKSMGLSKRAYLDAAAGLKGLLDNLGLAQDESTAWSRDLTQLGSDLASFFNTDPADAIDAIGAALRGESEPLRRYNVMLTDATVKAKAFELGLYSGKGAIEASAKAQATLALITEQTSAAQGDFARTADGAANAQRIAKAEMENSAASLGQNFLPVYERVVEVVGFLADKFAGLPSSVQVGVVALAAIVAFAGPIGKTVDLTRDLVKGFREMGPNARNAAGSIAVLAAALAGLDYWNKVTENAGDAKDAVNEFFVATDKASFATDQGVLDLANSFTKLAKAQGQAQGDVDKTLDVLSAGFRDGNVQANLLGEQMKETFDQLLDIDPSKAFDVAMALDNIRQAADAGNKSARENLDSYGLTNAIIDDFVSKAENATAAQQILSGATADTSKKLDTGASSARTYARHIRDLKDAFSGLLGELDRRDTIRNMQQGFDDLQEAADAAYFAAASGSADAEQKARDYQQALDDQKRKVIELADEIGNVPPETVSNIIAMIDEGKRAEAEAALLALERDRRVMFSAVLDPRTDKITIGSLGNIALSARGRYVDRPMITAVGEGGRREAILPLENQARMVELLGDPRIGGPVADAMGASGGGATTAANGGGVVINAPIAVYGAERQYVTDIARRIEQIKAGG